MASKSAATRDRESNEKIQEENRESVENINQQNLDFQRENLEYQKALQQQIFEREDSSYQRTAADMRAAGISPLAMNGTNGAGEAIATSPLQAGQPYAVQGLYNRAQNMQAMLGLVNQTVATLDNIARTPSAINYQLAETNALNQQSKYFDKVKNYRIRSEFAKANEDYSRAKVAEYEAADARRKDLFNRQYGINSDMTEYERAQAIYSYYMGQDVDRVLSSLDSEGNAQYDRYYGQDYARYRFYHDLSKEVISEAREFINALKGWRSSNGNNNGNKYDPNEMPDLPF